MRLLSFFSKGVKRQNTLEMQEQRAAEKLTFWLQFSDSFYTAFTKPLKLQEKQI